MKKNNKLRHTIFSINESWTKESKKNFIQFIKNLGVEAACIIHTPFDESDAGVYYLSTMYVFYYGIIKNVQLAALQNDLDETNQTLFKVLQSCYLNAGIKKGMHPVSWIGQSMYCKLESENYSPSKFMSSLSQQTTVNLFQG